jgi:acetolactate synthase-1/2/3 large subunit
MTRTEEFEELLLAALDREQGTLIEVMLDPEYITTRGTLSGIRNAAAEQKKQSLS